jgi:hypothetical protein
MLLDIIDHHRPASIVETGTWSGERATQMALTAMRHQDRVHYIGFDLFEDANAASDARELNVKRHYSLDEVWQRLHEFRVANPGFSFTLFKGDTRHTLAEALSLGHIKPDPDFAFIDGGHSIQTIASDWTALMRAKVIVLDDYYQADNMGRRPDIMRYGCNRLVDDLDRREWSVAVHSAGDPVSGGGVVALAEVRRRVA